MSGKIRLAIVYHHRLLGESLTFALSQEEDFCVSELADHTPPQAIAHLKASPVDIVLIDVELPQGGAYEMMRLIGQEFPEVKLVMFGVSEPEATIIEYIEGGASGYVLNDASLSGLLEIIRTVYRGETVCSAKMAHHLFSRIAELAGGTDPKPDLKAAKLTSRETEVLEMVANGLSNKEIAKQLNLSIYTVKNHVHNILEKLRAHSRIEVIRSILPARLWKATRPLRQSSDA